MERFRSLAHWILATDPALTWDQRLQRWSALSGIVSLIAGTVWLVVGWALDSPSLGWYALLVGLVVWVFALNGLLAIGRRAQPSASTLESQIQQLTIERDALKEENRGLRSEPGDEGLKQRCIQLSSELFRFSEDRDKEDPQNRPGWTLGNPFSKDPESRERAQKAANHNNATRAEYSQQYGGEVGALLSDLERRGWLAEEERIKLEKQVTNPILNPSAQIRQIAQCLATIGKRI